MANAIKEIYSGIITGEGLAEKEQPSMYLPWEEDKKERLADGLERISVSRPVDRQLLRMIENEYPYPIALEFRRLNTKEYLNHDKKRLMQILKISETTIHLVSLTSLVDLLENVAKSVISIPESFKKDFPYLFTFTSFGKWISLAKACIKLFLDCNVQMFISEMKEYFFESDGSESKFLKSFNILTDVRNRLAKPESVLTSKIIDEFCV